MKELQEDQNLVVIKADKGNTVVLIYKGYYCTTLVMKHIMKHLNTSRFQTLDSGIEKRKKKILFNQKLNKVHFK